MKNALIICLLILSTKTLFTQNKAEAEKLVEEGIAYHDKGDYKGAIIKYDKALELDKNNFFCNDRKSIQFIVVRKI